MLSFVSLVAAAGHCSMLLVGIK